MWWRSREKGREKGRNQSKNENLEEQAPKVKALNWIKENRKETKIFW